MTLFEQLEKITLEERAAIIAGDWVSLQSCVEQKDLLASQLGKIPLTDIDVTQARRISQATRYNLELASALHRQLGEMLTFQQRETVYDQRGRIPRRAPALMRIMG